MPESVYIPPRDPDAILVRCGDVMISPRVAVFQGKPEDFRGVYGPTHPKGGSNFLIPPGESGNERRMQRGSATVMGLLRAATEYHNHDAHQRADVLSTAAETHVVSLRTNKKHDTHNFLKSLGFSVGFTTITIDFDNPSHDHNNDDSRAEWMAKLGEFAEHPALDGAGWFFTRGGVHMKWVLDEMVTDPDVYERIVWGQMARVLESGITVGGRRLNPDTGCRDWTRFMRLPRVIRDDARFSSQMIDFSRLRAKHFDPANFTSKAGKVRERVPRSPVPYQVDDSIPPHVEALLPNFTPADHPPGAGRHAIMMHVGGALLGKGVAPEIVPAVVRAIALKLGYPPDHAEEDFRTAKDGTVATWQIGDPVTGMGRLIREAPLIAAKVDVLALCWHARRAADAILIVPLQPADAAGAMVLAALRAAMVSDRLSLIGGPCGLGKTEYSITAMIENLAGMYPGPLKGKHAEHAKRALIVTPFERTAKELQQRAHKRGLPMLRLTSPVSERNDDGSFVCKYHPQVSALARGQIPAKYNACDGGGNDSDACDLRSTCTAATGAVALDAAGKPFAVELTTGISDVYQVVVATHNRAEEGLALLGVFAKFGIDEIPQRVSPSSVTDADIKETIATLIHFDPNYAEDMLPALQALDVYRTKGPLCTTDMYLAAAMAEAPGDPTASARFARFPAKQRGTAPPVKTNSLRASRSALDTAKKIGNAARVLGLVWRALQEPTDTNKFSSRIVNRKVGGEDVPEYVFIEPSEIMRLAVERVAPVFILSADVVEQAPEIQSLMAGAPVLTGINSADGCKVHRRMILHPAASRSRSMPDGQIVAGGDHLKILESVAKWSDEYGNFDKFLLITWLVLELAIRASRGEDVAALWAEAKQTSSLKSIASEIRGVLPARGGSFATLHYGAETGIDAFRDWNKVALVGDPTPNVDAMNAEADHLGLTEALADALPRSRASVTLRQASGRIGGPRRVEPAAALHVGRGDVWPAGWEQFGYQIQGGDSTMAEAMMGAGGACYGAKGAEHGTKGAKYGALGGASGASGGRPKAPAIDVAVERARLGSLAAVAKEYGVSLSAVERQGREQTKSRTRQNPPPDPILRGLSDTMGGGVLTAYSAPLEDEPDERAAIQAANDTRPASPDNDAAPAAVPANGNSAADEDAS